MGVFLGMMSPEGNMLNWLRRLFRANIHRSQSRWKRAKEAIPATRTSDQLEVLRKTLPPVSVPAQSQVPAKAPVSRSVDARSPRLDALYTQLRRQTQEFRKRSDRTREMPMCSILQKIFGQRGDPSRDRKRGHLTVEIKPVIEENAPRAPAATAVGLGSAAGRATSSEAGLEPTVPPAARSAVQLPTGEHLRRLLEVMTEDEIAIMYSYFREHPVMPSPDT